MTANTVRDAFGRLPEELRIQIIKSSPDPWSLWSLTYASPVMGGVLDRYPLEILEVVLDAAVPRMTRRLMYAVLKVQLQRFPASLAEAKEVAGAEVTKVTDDMRSFTLGRAAAAVRSLLATAENVHTWSHACLEHLIQNSMEMRPSTIIEQGRGGSGSYGLWCIFDNAESRKDYVPQYTGPPSWVEEQRVIQAFWRIQSALELQDVGNKGGLSSHWSRQEVDALSNTRADRFFSIFNNCQQTFTASDFISAVTSGDITSVEISHEDACGLPIIHWTQVPKQRCSCAQPLFFEPKQDVFQQGVDMLDRYNWQKAIRMHNHMSAMPLDGIPYLLGIPFDPFRKFGFAIWDGKRMTDLGMQSGNPRYKTGTGNYPFDCFRWWSVLTNEELCLFKELERTRKILECEIPYDEEREFW